MKEFADDNFNFDENDGKFPKWIENTVGKGEIARYEQFLPFPQYFQKPGLVWERVKNEVKMSFIMSLTFKSTIRGKILRK